MFPGFGKDKKVGQLVDRRCLFLGFFGLLYPGAVETHGDAGLGTGWLLLLSQLSQNDCHLSASHPRPANGPIRPLSSLPPRNPRPSHHHHHRLNSQLLGNGQDQQETFTASLPPTPPHGLLPPIPRRGRHGRLAATASDHCLHLAL